MRRNHYGAYQEATNLWALFYLAFWSLFCIVIFDAAIGFRANRRRSGGPRNGPRDRRRDGPDYGPDENTRNEAWIVFIFFNWL